VRLHDQRRVYCEGPASPRQVENWVKIRAYRTYLYSVESTVCIYFHIRRYLAYAHLEFNITLLRFLFLFKTI
jgi:hypothetical protein